MLNHITLNGIETIAPCCQCGEEAKIKHGRIVSTGSPVHKVQCGCGTKVVYVGYFCPNCMPAAEQVVTRDLATEFGPADFSCDEEYIWWCKRNDITPST